MKKIALLLFFGLCMQMGHAQLNDVRFGLQVSPSFAWMTANNNRVNSSGTNLGLKLGMLGEFYFRPNYAFSTGIGFSFNYGGTLQHEWAGFYWEDSYRELTTDTTALPQQTKLKYNIQFLEIPLGLKLISNEFGPAGNIRYFVEPAITLGIKTQAKGEITGVGVGDGFDDINIRREVNPINLAWGLTAGIEYGLGGSTALVAGIGFQVGFADVTRDGDTVINPNTNDTSEEESSGRSHAITIRLGVMF